MSSECAVVIPFYQRTDGILRRALQSIAGQSHTDWHVFVVDDASPHPGQDELAPLPLDFRARITLIEQDNAGPGGARNCGLDALDSDRFALAAFLDSDDTWDRDHLSRATAAISEEGADLYLAAIGGEPEFDYHADMGDIVERWPNTRQRNEPPLYELDALGERMLVDWSFMHLSCMALSPALYTTVRFEPALRLAAEDVVFFHDCVRLASQTLVSPEPGAVRGHGDNLFHGVDNTADKFLAQQKCVWRAFRMIDQRADLTEEGRDILKRRRRRARRLALWGQMARLKGGQGLQIGSLIKWAKDDPGILATAAGLATGRKPDDTDLV